MCFGAHGWGGEGAGRGPSVRADAGAAESSKRRQILDGARRVFLAEGFDGASMGEIARAAGVSKGTLYVYFDSKEKLFEALTIEEKKSLAEVLFQPRRRRSGRRARCCAASARAISS